MSVRKHPRGASAARSGRIQFGLSTLLVLTAFVALTCTLFFRLPNKVATPGLLAISVALPAVFTTVAIYGPGYRRTFCIGALFPAGALLVCTCVMLMIHLISAYMNDVDIWVEFAEAVGPYYRPCVALAWGLCVVLGVLCMVVRRLTERANRKGGTTEESRASNP